MQIEVADVAFRYVAWRMALRGVQGVFAPGITAIVGRNGSGKSTLLRLLATRLRPTSGTIRYVADGVTWLQDHPGAMHDAATLSTGAVRTRMGYVPQHDAIPDQLTVGHFMDYLALLKGFGDAQTRQAECQHVLDRCDLAALAGRVMGALSAGERRRVLIAQALLGSPELVILDEPFAGLDSAERNRLLPLIATNPQRTTIWATHDQAELAPIATQWWVLRAGQLAFHGTAANLAALDHGDLSAGLRLMLADAPRQPTRPEATRSTLMLAPQHVQKVSPRTGFTIAIEQISKNYRGRPRVLSDISFTIPPGVFGLLGRNGAGKTTLLQILATLLDPSSGTARIGPYDIQRDRWEIRRRLGFVPQEHGFYPGLSVRETLHYLATLQHLQEIDRAIERVLALTNLADLARRRVGTLSGGMRRRLSLAQALLGDPPVLIVDEPTAGLDPIEQQRFREMLGVLGADGQRTIVLSTHIVEDVAATATAVAVLEAGRVRFTGTPAELAARAEGLTWHWQTTVAEVERRRAAGELVVAALVPLDGQPGMVTAAIIGPPPDDQVTPRPPGLADGYLAYLESQLSGADQAGAESTARVALTGAEQTGAHDDQRA